jgi:hypothetical protein
LLELARRQVDADLQVREAQMDLPVAGLTARIAKDPATHRDDVTGLLRQVDELVGHQERTPRQLPAYQCLDADDGAALELDDRLVVEAKLAALLGAAQEPRQLAARDSVGCGPKRHARRFVDSLDATVRPPPTSDPR